jgi:hypothetical protein
VGEVIILRQHPLFVWLAFIHASVDLSTAFSDGHGSGGGLILSTPLLKFDCVVSVSPGDGGWGALRHDPRGAAGTSHFLLFIGH